MYVLTSSIFVEIIAVVGQSYPETTPDCMALYSSPHGRVTGLAPHASYILGTIAEGIALTFIPLMSSGVSMGFPLEAKCRNPSVADTSTFILCVASALFISVPNQPFMRAAAFS